MRRVELEIEHKYKNKFVGRHRIKQSEAMFILGSSRDANIRLLGEDVSPIHAAIEWDERGWRIADLGSQKGTWIKKKPVIDYLIKGNTSVRIGGHHIKVIVHEIDHSLFTDRDVQDIKDKRGEQYHQVIVRRFGYVLDATLLPASEDYHYKHGNKIHKLTAATSPDWVVQEFGDVEVRRRLVKAEVINDSHKQKLFDLWDPNLKYPLAAAFAFLLIIFGIVLSAPDQPEEELVAHKPDKNRYSRIIYDAKSIKTKREKAIKQTKNIVGRTQEKATVKSPKIKVAKKRPPSNANRVVKKIKAAGLSRLIGKISKRASKSATFIKSRGRAPHLLGSGKASVKAGSLGGISKGTKKASYRVAGIATTGKGGGSKSYKGFGGLAVGNVGNASVGVLEEETDIQGGLDRDVIARYIKSQLGQIRYCYERQLSASPDLYGKVQVKFTIGSAGSVTTQAIGLTTLKNAMVEGCILRRVAGWRFPKPKGGTDVLVTYPFLFKSTN